MYIALDGAHGENDTEAYRVEIGENAGEITIREKRLRRERFGAFVLKKTEQSEKHTENNASGDESGD